MASREIKNEEWSDAGRGHHRQVPEDLDWVRRYIGIKLVDDRDGNLLQEKLERMNSEEWARFKNAARQHKHNTRSSFSVYLNRTAIRDQSPGFLWRRVVAAGLCNEEDMLRYCEGGVGLDGEMRWSDVGCRVFFKNALHAAASSAKKDDRARRGVLAAIEKYVEKVRAEEGDDAAEVARIKMLAG